MVTKVYALNQSNHSISLKLNELSLINSKSTKRVIEGSENYMLMTWRIVLFGSLQMTLFSCVLLPVVFQPQHCIPSKSHSLPNFLPILLNASATKKKKHPISKSQFHNNKSQLTNVVRNMLYTFSRGETRCVYRGKTKRK